MVSAKVLHAGKTNLIFIEKRIKLNAQSYCDDILSKILPDIEDTMLNCFMQDEWAPSYQADRTINNQPANEVP